MGPPFQKVSWIESGAAPQPSVAESWQSSPKTPAGGLYALKERRANHLALGQRIVDAELVFEIVHGLSGSCFHFAFNPTKWTDYLAANLTG
jgi:hypothetical protein